MEVNFFSVAPIMLLMFKIKLNVLYTWVVGGFR